MTTNRAAQAIATFAGRYCDDNMTEIRPITENIERAYRLLDEDRLTARLDDLRVLAGQVELMTWSKVRQMRQEGWSWQVIGNDLGITRQAAQQRYRDLS